MSWDRHLPRNAIRPIRDGGRQDVGQGAPAGAKVTFSFFAPRNLAVNVLGDFTKWRPEPMQRDARGWWWCARHLPDGGYGYRFQVLSVTPGSEGQWVNVTDLRAPCLHELAQRRAVRCVEGSGLRTSRVGRQACATGRPCGNQDHGDKAPNGRRANGMGSKRWGHGFAHCSPRPQCRV